MLFYADNLKLKFLEQCLLRICSCCYRVYQVCSMVFPLSSISNLKFEVSDLRFDLITYFVASCFYFGNCLVRIEIRLRQASQINTYYFSHIHHSSVKSTDQIHITFLLGSKQEKKTQNEVDCHYVHKKTRGTLVDLHC